MFLLSVLILSEVNAEEIHFEFNDLHQSVNSGYIQLKWMSDPASDEYWLEQSQDSLFQSTKQIYQGPDQASFISGLEDGNYYYRVRTAGTTWSEPLVVTVEHQSLNLALSLAGIGMLVFGLTTAVIIKGSHSTTADT